MKATIKARVIATNEVVRVYQAKEGDMHFIDENNNPYMCEELDFNVEEQPIDPIERLEKMMEILKPTPIRFPTQDEINASNLRFERAKFKMEKEKMRLQFICDLVLKDTTGYKMQAYEDAEMIANKIFDNDKG